MKGGIITSSGLYSLKTNNRLKVESEIVTSSPKQTNKN